MCIFNSEVVETLEVDEPLVTIDVVEPVETIEVIEPVVTIDVVEPVVTIEVVEPVVTIEVVEPVETNLPLIPIKRFKRIIQLPECPMSRLFRKMKERRKMKNTVTDVAYERSLLRLGVGPVRIIYYILHKA
jgi:hypothetical protein